MSDTPSETSAPDTPPATDPNAPPATDPNAPPATSWPGETTQPANVPGGVASSDPTAQADATVQAPTAPPAPPAPPAPIAVVDTTVAAPVETAPLEPTDASLIGQPAPAPLPEESPSGQTISTHAIAPGSAGAPVLALAQELERAGETTYLSTGAQNPAHVFTDDLMAAVKRVLHSHPSIAGVSDEAERQRLNRWIGGLEVITAEVQRLITEVADARSGGSAETTTTTVAPS